MNGIAAVCLFLGLTALARAQIPSLGFCPDYVPMTDFDMDKFAGVWYEAERYFQLTEVASRCVMSNYTKGADGKFRVSNEVTSRLTGIKRILEGEIRVSPKRDEGKLIVKYTSVPLITPETSYSVLETDYDNYAVLWSCAGFLPLHTQNAWIMTRERLPAGEVLQKAYAVLDKYKISKLYFVKTSQDDCAYLDQPLPTKKPVRKPTTPAPASEEDEQADEPSRNVQPIVEPEVIVVPEITNIIPEAVRNVPQEVVEPVVEQVVPVVPEEVKTVPEVIMEIAEQQQQIAEEPSLKSAVVVPQEVVVPVVKVPEPETLSVPVEAEEIVQV